MTMGTIATVVEVAGAAYSAYSAYQNGQTQQDLAKQTLAASNPFGPYRAQYAQQLNSVMADPSNALKDPAFASQTKYGLDNVARTMASQGYLGSGLEAKSLQDYSTTSLSNYEQWLAKLAGVDMQPGTASAAALGAYGSGTTSEQAGLGQLGSTLKLFGSMWSGGGGGGSGLDGSAGMGVT